jgi:hypothetical protein
MITIYSTFFQKAFHGDGFGFAMPGTLKDNDAVLAMDGFRSGWFGNKFARREKNLLKTGYDPQPREMENDGCFEKRPNDESAYASQLSLSNMAFNDLEPSRKRSLRQMNIRQCDVVWFLQLVQDVIGLPMCPMPAGASPVVGWMISGNIKTSTRMTAP